MTYFPKTKIELADSPSVDAFGRLRVSNAITLFDSKQVHDISDDIVWTTRVTNGGTSVYSGSRASTVMTVPVTTNSEVVRQTKQRMNYQPGKSFFTDMTFVIGDSAPDLIKRAGLFDDDNGIYLEQSGSDINLCMRSSISGTNNIICNQVSQSQWNLDKLDGTGISGITLDLTKAQLFSLDVQWLGVGRVRAGFSFDGGTIYAHEFNHANIADSVYISTPVLPIRFQIINSGSSAGSMEHICSSVISEGGYSPLGILRSIDRGVNAITLNSGSFAPILSIRLNPAYIGSTILPTESSILTLTNTAFKWALLLNPVIAGTDNANWQTISGSSVQYDTSRTTANTLTSGTQIISGYAEAGGPNQKSSGLTRAFESNLVIGSDIDGNTDELVLAAQLIGNGANADFLGTLAWRELI